VGIGGSQSIGASACAESAIEAARVLYRDWTEPIEPVKKPRLGIPDGPYLQSASPVGLAHFESVCKLLENAGYELQHIQVMSDFAEIKARHDVIMSAEAAQVQVARRNAPIELVRQVVYPVDRQRKRELLSHLIRTGRIDRALVFTRTKHGANRLAEQLAYDGIDAVAIHGNKSQGQRIRALDDFKEGRAAILVATEVAARGLDIDGLPHVVNYELPTVSQDYIHRIGRTGRAGMEGDAISLVCIDERDLLEDIERLLRGPIPWETVPGFEPDRRVLAEPIPEVTRGGRPSPRARGRRSPHRRTASRPPVRSDGPRAHTVHAPRPATTHGTPHRPAAAHGAPVQPSGSRPFVALPGERFSRSTGS